MRRTVSFNAFLRGTGKSNLVANTAALLGGSGRSVGVVDLDEAGATLPLLFGLAPGAVRATLGDILAGTALPGVAGAVGDVAEAGGSPAGHEPGRALPGEPPARELATGQELGSAIYDVTPREAASAGGRLLLLPLTAHRARVPSVLRKGLDTDLLAAALHQFAESCALDFMLIDSSTGVNELSMTALAVSDEAVQLLRLDQRHYQGTAVLLDLARRFDVPCTSTIATLIPAGVEPEHIRAQLARTFGSEAPAILPYADEVAALGSRQLIVLSAPHHPYSLEVARVAAWLDGRIAPGRDCAAAAV